MTAPEPVGRRPVGVGVVGAGVISPEYLQNLTTFPDLDVRFVADLDECHARTRADEHGVPGAGSVADMLADATVELVVNLTIPSAHVAVDIQALDAGKHVWSEKPLALDRESGRRVLDRAHTAGRRVGCAPDTFLGEALQASRRFIERGGIGEPLTALTLVQDPGPEAWHPNPDFLFQDGAGPLFDLGPYYLTTLVTLFGPIARVSATASRSRAVRTVRSGARAGQIFEVTAPTHVAMQAEYASGQTSVSIFSFDSKLVRAQFEISGMDGTLVVPDPNGFSGELVVHRDRGIERVATVRERSTRGTGVLEMARAIRAGVPERASGAMAFHVLDVMVATVEAAERGTPVEVASTFTVAPVLPDDWDPHAATLA